MQPLITQPSEAPPLSPLADWALFDGDFGAHLMVVAPLIAVLLIRSHMRRARKMLAAPTEDHPDARG